MARHLFAPDTFFVPDAGGDVSTSPNAPFRVYTARVAGTDITASMTAADGVTALTHNLAGDILADSSGIRPWMMGPDDVVTIYIDPTDVSGDRYPVYADDVISIALASSGLDAEGVRDTMAAALVAGSNVTITVNDAADTITIASVGGGLDAEGVRDTIGAALVAGSNVTITPNDAGDTITIASTGGGATVNNLMSYGGVDPTGVADSSAAVIAWATAGGQMYAPAGTYKVNGATRPRITVDGSHMWGDGVGKTKFTCSEIYTGVGQPDRELFLVGQGTGAQISNIHIHDLSIEFTSVNTASGGGACLRASRVNNLKIKHVKAYGSTYGMVINRAHDFEISGCEVSNTFRDGIQMNNGSDTGDMTIKNGRVHHNHVHHTGDDGISCGGSQDGGVNRSQPEKVIIDHNDIHDLTALGGAIGVYGLNGGSVNNNLMTDITSSHFIAVRLDNQLNQYPTTNLKVRFNIGKNSPASPTVSDSVGGRHCISFVSRNTAFSGSELDIPAADNITFEGNEFEVTDRSGFWCQPASTMGSHPNKWPRRIRLIRNVFRFVGLTNQSANYRALHFQYGDDLEIDSNRFEGFPSNGIVLNQFKLLRYAKNKLINCNSDSAFAANNMMYVGDAATSTDTIEDFSDNRFRKSSGTIARFIDIRATGSTMYPYQRNQFNSLGATISAANETTDSKAFRGNGGPPASPNVQTGTSYTFTWADPGRTVQLNNAAAIAATVPPNSSIAYPIGTEITLTQAGAGQVTVGGGVGVTVTGAPGLKLLDQHSFATLVKVGTDTWELVGRLSA